MASKGGPGHNRKEQALKIAERRQVVVANLLAGADYREIAGALSVSVGTVAGDVKALMRQWEKESVSALDSHLKLELRRVNVLINTVWNDAKDKGFHDAGLEARLLTLQRRKLDLLGIHLDSLDITSGGLPLPAQPAAIGTVNVLGAVTPDEAQATLALYRAVVASRKAAAPSTAEDAEEFEL